MSKRLFLRYISQNIAGMIGLSCYILVDTWFVSLALGTNGLAALNLAITVFSIAASVSLRRKGFTKTGFFIQFVGVLLFAIPVAFDAA